MKLSIKIFFHAFLLTSMFMLNSFHSMAQSTFEGEIFYTINYTNLPEEMNGYEYMLPKEVNIHLKGNKSRVEQSQMMGTNVVISDMAKKSGFIEMDVNGKKLRISISEDEFNEQASDKNSIEYFDEIKVIEGYKCKKAIIKDENDEVMMTVYYTEKIKNKAQMQFVGLKGFPLEYTMIQQNMKMVMTATEITAKSVPDSLFEKSEGYKDISEAELSQELMGN